jgi:phage baseplate assembly protein W
MSNKRLYDKVVLKGQNRKNDVPGTKTYKGFSTISGDTKSFALFDLALIKQDIYNHFHIRQGERLENPTFGTVIWDVIFEPLTEDMKQVIVKNVEDIINYDPRFAVNEVQIDSTDQGIRIQADITYIPFNINERMTFDFDKNNSVIN